MNQREGFGSGFLAGAVLGSLVGGIIGSILASRGDMEQSVEESQVHSGSVETYQSHRKPKQIKVTNSEINMEMTRRSLEEKIAQLNITIDEVRQQLGNVGQSSVPVNSNHTSNT
ncbi:hypothetical protein RINTHH_3400 [Richelia intracellularis HH01]|uniref:Uncharacterized protein n=1 Tax=Richelia intracellularis HH01 TaxID=1165094 RepID=M1X2A7_9NOST|nr:hypothetical protein [Richelia intracellularis]CCH66495.1 hypothetical protein RINTHH_3400 [Richelia intracellularis HH01]